MHSVPRHTAGSPSGVCRGAPVYPGGLSSSVPPPSSLGCCPARRMVGTADRRGWRAGCGLGHACLEPRPRSLWYDGRGAASWPSRRCPLCCQLSLGACPRSDGHRLDRTMGEHLRGRAEPRLDRLLPDCRGGSACCCSVAWLPRTHGPTSPAGGHSGRLARFSSDRGARPPHRPWLIHSWCDCSCGDVTGREPSGRACVGLAA